ncbi:piwi domain-containing protein [Apiospora aurea]|uniref:Piwi domain-containing protein n=1 Tax=Apiospora aurea TaxID=335848 RepID=A0ABR1QKA4_9PEZI
MAPDKKRVVSGGSDAKSGSGQGSRSGSQSPAPASTSTSLPFRPADKKDDPKDGSEKQTEGGKGKKKERKKLTDLELVGKRVDLPIESYAAGAQESKAQLFEQRPAGALPGGEPKSKLYDVNAYEVKDYIKKNVPQYDVFVKDNKGAFVTDPPRGLVEKLWKHPTVQVGTGILSPGGIRWMFNGYNIAWSSPKMAGNEREVVVDFNPGSEKPNIFTLVVKYRKDVTMDALKAFLDDSASWSTGVLESINVLDHALRQTPSDSHKLIGRCFYNRQVPTPTDVGTVRNLNHYLEIIKGSFASIRLPGKRTGGLVVNADVSTTAFWKPLGLPFVITRMVPTTRDASLQAMLLPTTEGGLAVRPRAFQHLDHLVGLKFKVYIPKRAGGPHSPVLHTIKCFHFDETKPGGANSDNVGFTKIIDGKEHRVTISNHFREAYKYQIQHAKYPLVETMKKALFPLEVCQLEPYQQYRYKLDAEQTRTMLTHAATDPWVRKADIDAAVRTLNWGSDPNLRAFGITINSNMLQSQPRQLGFPTIYYGGSKDQPKDTKYNLRGRKFYQSQTFGAKKLTQVAFFSVGACCTIANLKTYSDNFKANYDRQGGLVESKWKVHWGDIPLQGGSPEGGLWAEFPKGKHEKYEFVFLVVGTANQAQYQCIKKHMDCRLRVPSQVLLYDSVKNNNIAYWSNVCLKAYAKLSGAPYITTTALPPPLAPETMMIGLDVSHAGPGSHQPSIAALCVSVDEHTASYTGSCQTNSYRKEIVDEDIMRSLLVDQAANWLKRRGKKPQHILYFRDGVSEGQFEGVIETEAMAIKRIVTERTAMHFGVAKESIPVKITVIVATKRHHIRSFNRGGKIANPEPGLYFEDVATHPKHWDFYLYSHKAHKGTARPVHYQVIKDEIKFGRAELANLIHRQCFQYCRCYTPVSLHPAVFYAHLASQRGRAHISSTTGPPVPMSDLSPKIRAPPLVSIGALAGSMWFV